MESFLYCLSSKMSVGWSTRLPTVLTISKDKYQGAKFGWNLMFLLARRLLFLCKTLDSLSFYISYHSKIMQNYFYAYQESERKVSANRKKIILVILFFYFCLALTFTKPSKKSLKLSNIFFIFAARCKYQNSKSAFKISEMTAIS